MVISSGKHHEKNKKQETRNKKQETRNNEQEARKNKEQQSTTSIELYISGDFICVSL
jgi:hypothetical protein